jgi:streptogramin lyase
LSAIVSTIRFVCGSMFVRMPSGVATQTAPFTTTMCVGRPPTSIDAVTAPRPGSTPDLAFGGVATHTPPSPTAIPVGNRLQPCRRSDNGHVGADHSAWHHYFGGGSLWATNSVNTAVLRLDPRTHVVLKRVRAHFDNPSEGGLSGFAYGSAWAGDQGSVTRIDAGTNRVTVIPLPGAKEWPDPAEQVLAAGAQMAFAGGKVFYGNAAGIYEIDAATNVGWAEYRRPSLGASHGPRGASD